MAQHSASPRGHGGSLCLYTWSSCGHFLEPLQCYALSERHGLTKRVQAPQGVALQYSMDGNHAPHYAAWYMQYAIL